MTPTADAIPGSGLGPDVAVSWEVADGQGVHERRRPGRRRPRPPPPTTPSRWTCAGLRPPPTYWYRFTAGDTVSPAGRTRTAPAADAATAGLRFGVVSCANWEAGYFAAYRHLAARGDLDASLHLGDYIYEYGTGEYAAGDNVVRPHAADARDPHPRRLPRPARPRTRPTRTSRRCTPPRPCVAIWDDHEVANDAWSGGAENHTQGTEGDWAARQAAAQAGVLRVDAGAHRRSRAPSTAGCASASSPTCPCSTCAPSARSRSRSATARSTTRTARSPAGAQLDWLKAGLTSLRHDLEAGRQLGDDLAGSPSARCTADLLEPARRAARPAAGGPRRSTPTSGTATPTTAASCSPTCARTRIRNTVFLTGDIHMAWANDVPVNAGTYPLSALGRHRVRRHVGHLRQPRRHPQGRPRAPSPRSPRR